STKMLQSNAPLNVRLGNLLPRRSSDLCSAFRTRHGGCPGNAAHRVADEVPAKLLNLFWRKVQPPLSSRRSRVCGRVGKPRHHRPAAWAFDLNPTSATGLCTSPGRRHLAL